MQRRTPAYDPGLGHRSRGRGDSCFVAVNLARLASHAAGLASPHSSSFAPVGVSMIFPCFESRYTTPGSQWSSAL